MMDSFNEAQQEALEGLQDKMERVPGGGGGRKHKRRGKDTLAAIAKEVKGNQLENSAEKEGYRTRIDDVLKRVMERNPNVGFDSLEVYIDWLCRSMREKGPLFVDSELDFQATRDSGPGGQNRNKVSTAVNLDHVPTGIEAYCANERTQTGNRTNAEKMLAERLGNHLDDWRKLLGEPQNEDYSVGELILGKLLSPDMERKQSDKLAAICARIS